MPSLARLDYLKTIHQTFHEQLRTADQKAALIFTFLLALMLWSPELRGVFFSGGLEPASLKGTATIVLIAALMFSIACVLIAVIPRDRPGGVALYWGAWPNAGLDLLEKIEDEDPSTIAQDYVNNAAHLAALCRQKFRWVRLAMIGFSIALAAHLAIILAV
jgi:hypothetical protein